MKNWILVFITLGLAACSTLDKPVTPALNTVTETKAVSEKPEKAESVPVAGTKISPKAKTQRIPPSTLTKQLLFKVMAGEMAYQRGQPVFAYQMMIDAAEEAQDARLARRAAEFAVRINPREAVNAVRLWHTLDPDSKDSERFFLLLLILDNQLGEVEKIMSARLAKASPNERVMLMSQYQQYLNNASNKEQGFSVLETILAPYDKMPEVHTTLAISAYLNKNTDRAVSEARKALELKPDSEYALLILVQALKEPQAALNAIRKFLQKYPAAREVRLTYARLLIAVKDYDGATQEFKKLHAARPHDLNYLYSLALLAIQQKDMQAAEQYLQQYLNTAAQVNAGEAERTIQVLFLLAQIAEEAEEYDRAIMWLEKVSAYAEKNAWLSAQLKTAHIMAKKGDLPLARKKIAQLRKEHPGEYEQLILSEAQILRSRQMFQDAYGLLKQAVTEYPDNINLLYDFSLNAEKLEKYDEMEKSLRHIIELDAKNAQAYNALGYSLADRNIRLDEAYALIDKALKLSPNDGYIIDSMGWVLFRMGQHEKAEEMLRVAFGLQKDPEIMIHLGEILWVRGKQQEARLLWQNAQEREPGNELLRDTLKRLGVEQQKP